MSETNEPAVWGDDPLSKHLDSLVANMPDRPPVAFILLTENPADYDGIENSMRQYKESFVNFQRVTVFERFTYGTCLMAFYHDSPVNLGQFIELVSKLPISEAVFYVEGKARLRVSPLAP